MREDQFNSDDLVDESLLLQIRALGHLPSPSSSALKLYSLIQTEDADIREMAAVIKGDVALTARVLLMANRAGAAAGRPVAAVEDALVRLGLKTVASLAIGLSVIDEALACKTPDSRAYLDICYRSLAAGVLAEWLSDRPKVPACAADMFTCALLAHSGQMALLRFYPQPYADMLCQKRESYELLELEKNQLGINHQLITMALLHEWGFPEVLSEAIRLSEAEPEKRLGEERRQIMAQILNFAWEASASLVEGNRAQLLNLLPGALARLGQDVAEGDVVQMADNLQKRWGEWCPQSASQGERTMNQAALSASEEQPVSGQLALLLVGVPEPELSAWTEIFQARKYAVDFCSNLHEVGQLLIGQVVNILLVWQPPQAGCKLLETWVKDSARAALVIQEDLDEATQIEFLKLGVDAVVPRTVNPEYLLAQVGRLAAKVGLFQTLEAERDAHRKLLAELVLTTRKLHLQTLTDPLTGLANRRMADAFLKRHWAQVERRKIKLSCLVIDLDNFKKINDLYGHDAGDSALRAFSTILKRHVRQEDLAVRLGGDEFLVICPLATAADLEILRHRLMRATGQLKLETGSLEFSMGIAESDLTTMRSYTDLLKLADQHLIQSKRMR